MGDVGINALKYAYKIMKIDREWTVLRRRGFTWWGGPLAQHAWAESPYDDRGFQIIRVQVRTDLLAGFRASDEQLRVLGPLMRSASMSGLARDPANPSRLQLAANLYIHAEVAEWLQRVLALVMPLQATEAHMLAAPLADVTGAEPAATAHPECGRRQDRDEMVNIIQSFVAPHGQGGSRYQGTDMLDAVQGPWGPPCVVASGEPQGLAAEFPFDDSTSLLRATTVTPHTDLGHGLLMLLTLPAAGDDATAPAAVRRALEMNEQELASRTHQHFLGSWCPHAAGMTFVSFFPNAMMMFSRGCIQTLVGGSCMRARWATENVFGAAWDYERAARGCPYGMPESPSERTAWYLAVLAHFGQTAAQLNADPANTQPWAPSDAHAAAWHGRAQGL
jgi:hypothetical protein